MWYVIRKQCPESQTVLTMSTKSRPEPTRSWDAWWFFKMKARQFCVHCLTKRRRWIKSQQLEYIYSFFPPIPPFSFPPVLDTHTAIKQTASILNYLDITWLAENNASRSKTHPITYTTLYLHSGLLSAMFNSIIMLTPRMYIHFQLAPITPKGSRKGKRKATDRPKLPTWVINRRLSLDRDRIKAFISEHICGLLKIYNVCSINDERAWDLFLDIIFLDRVTTHHFSKFQVMWPHRRSRSWLFREWWAAFHS